MIECKNTGTSEYLELKSRFLGFFFSVTRQELFQSNMENLRLEHPDASHLVYAYRYLSEQQLFEKYSDDREPYGTAGLPLLSLLQKRTLMNTGIIVVRYFGGTKLGKKHLLSAYLRTGVGALDKAEIVERKSGYRIALLFQYEILTMLEHWLTEHRAKILERHFSQEVSLSVWIEEKDWHEFQRLPYIHQLRINSFNQMDML